MRPIRTARFSSIVLALLACAATCPARADEPAGKPKPKHPANRLAKETSPYLLLHAHNPVDWHPWGEEALEKAKREKKLIFLSIGYSSCYWCHVMERESFMDDEIAKLLNKHFVCIKVDREERPDIDEIYMRALEVYHQASGSGQGGGWPLSMFLTPEARPLAGGTYFPPRDKDGRVGFLTVLTRIHEAWASDEKKWRESADKLTEYVRDSLQRRSAAALVPLEPKLLDEVEEALAAQYDETYGGFGVSPSNDRRAKFPEAPNLVFLLGRAAKGSERAKKMLMGTLDQMARGGIRDHLGGGFHRYSTDRYWRVPHFEKMLYDNGQLASVYADAFALEPRDELRSVVDEINAFVLREMTDNDGAFFTALDAETDAEEGVYYVWQRKELAELLGKDELKLIEAVYGVGQEPNFEGRHILLLSRPLAEIAAERKVAEAELLKQLAGPHKKLLAARQKRPRPLTDTKILASSNGLMIRGLADAGRVFKNDGYTKAAARAADFVLARLRTPDGRLLRTYAAGQAKQSAFLDDYAFFIDGLVALHQATGERRWLAAADELCERQVKWFWDDRGGGFFFTPSDHEQLIARSKPPTDGAVPSGNAVSAANLVYLGRALPKPAYVERAQKTLQAFSSWLKDYPAAVPRLAAAYASLLEAKSKK